MATHQGRSLIRHFLLPGLFWLGLVLPAHAVVLYDTGDPLANTAAPDAAYSGSGWEYQGLYGSFMGTMIAPQYFITAQHIGVSASPTFTSTAAFNGLADITYTIDMSANGGTGYWDIAGTDLRIFKINESFSSYAQLYTGSAEEGMDLVVFGRGGPRGAEVLDGTDLKGWYHTGSDGVARWGTNEVDGISNFGSGDLLRADFDAVGGGYESTLSSGDSGGAVFVNDNGVWKLAGINFGVDGSFDTNNVVDDNEFDAALFDRGGYYQGADGSGWFGPLPDGSPASFYASRISTSALEIQAIAVIPEPGSLLMVILAAGLIWQRRRLHGEA